MHGTSSQPLTVRSYQPCDEPACRRLFVEGLLATRAADAPDPADPGTDIADIAAYYLQDAGSHLWVVTLTEDLAACEGGPAGVGKAGDVVGMIGVKRRDNGTAEIRRLRVDARFRRRGIGSVLVEQALRFCQQHHYLRVILDTYMERDPAVSLFRKFHFQHGHSRPGKRQERHYFYLDLYGCPGTQPGK